MVFSTAQPPRETYLLWRVFNFPTDHGLVLAIAVPSSWRDPVVGLYSGLVGMAFIQVWVLLLSVVFWRRQRQNRKRESMLRVAYHEEARFFKALSWVQHSHSSTKKVAWPWSWLAAIFVVFITNMFLGPVLSNQLSLGDGAPANGKNLYFPQGWNDFLIDDLNAKQVSIFKPSVLRALGVAQVGRSDADARVQITQVDLGRRPDSQAILRFDYSYNITATDFGMQHFGGLRFDVQGSCYTEYGWTKYQNNSYYLWDRNTSVYFTNQQLDSPQAVFHLGTPTTINGLAKNFTWAAIVPTFSRWSRTNGTDPWYSTDYSKRDSKNGWIPIKNNPPALSCWETNGWTYNNELLGDTWTWMYQKPDVGFHEVMDGIFYSQLTQPGIVSTGGSLGTINLAISDQDTIDSFDAASGSIFNDLHRLLVTTFVWNTNILSDTALNSLAPKFDVPNYIERDPDGAADFVVQTTAAAAMSLVFLIVVPLLVVFLFFVSLYADKMTLIDEGYGPCEKCIDEGGSGAKVEAERKDA